jgi:hypothetical protein
MTFRSFFVCLGLAVATVVCLAQTQPAPVEADRILMKIRELDLLNQILPVLMKPEQIKKILPALEKAREAEKRIQKDEVAVLKKLEPTLDPALASAKDKGQVPTRETLNEMFGALRDLRTRRLVMVAEQSENVLKTVEETLDAGQIKAAANSLDPKIGHEGMDVTKLSDRDKLRTWVRIVLMDPAAYGLLVDLSRKKDEAGAQSLA